ncbi:MAG: L-glutamate gamma-semialdehyde dehydrogenase [Meiothermus sp.]|uniref:L-glutamate gamma-semialdehyde dehydrogenase n=1 Tax=Meiothermus sp. TaxID=1955249 RepID=UPI0025D7E9C6|nr:L-glutamate gamma-semialdehyde dehydrogenase [Meiothermus sp.]MCS7058972.1 L-glutamate gamma-semialdehyde dehydrogenase [Meiothermus sp.]MCS7195598.1 L-glutamate gamma-semialdehyde dehydrogenase [Meiothermus sp.]MCX7741400.1 L-glutamate gamma-semialdehyde dehydrogenase [Meiothermus sp.]MDW8091472.1 L-glutamate gamma-semialdehyde dehydrogenase [Meiothermus sp.]MDW8480327.1 L-glutamate gamma-semialdehyde dehydrogenase [Meiothermus sp.]
MTPEPYRPEPVETFQSHEAFEAMRKALIEVRAQFGRHYPLIIGGERVNTPEAIVSTNPSNPVEVVGQSAKAGIAEADAALDAAWRAFPGWRDWPQEHRSRLLLKAAQIMKRRQRELEAWLVYEIGKNWTEAAADVAEAIDFLRYYAISALKYKDGAPVLPYPGEDNEAFYIPLGAGVVIAPWNFPLAILTGMTAAPIAVGNTVVVKPAEDTVVAAAKLFEVLEEAGLPPGVANYLPGEGSEVGAYLVRHPRTRFINFTGSLEVGLQINETAARLSPGQVWFKRVFLELGGKDAIIVDETADLKAAAQATVQSAFGFQGQKCSAASRLIVVDGIYDLLVEEVLGRTEALIVGPAEENPDLGPLASQKQEETVLSYIEVGRQEGRLLLGGRRLEGSGFFVAPTLFDRVSPDARIAQEEIFGPVLSVLRVPDFDTALEVANNTRYGLTGGVFSRKRERLEKARREFHVGNLYFNRKITGALVGVQPFGGFNLSGTDTKAGGPDYLLNFLQMKSVTERF